MSEADGRTHWAVNPVGLARVVTGEFGLDTSHAFVTKLLGDAFEDDVTTILFGTATKPGILALLDDVRLSADMPTTVDAALGHPVVGPLAERLDRDKVARILPFLVPLSDVRFVTFGDAAPATRMSIGAYAPLAGLEIDTVSWRDPVQGAAWDCYLIATMISIAWSCPAQWRVRLSSATGSSKDADRLRFAFHGTAHETTIEMAPTVPTSTNAPIYARSSTAGESWPALVEKAYVIERCRPADEPTVADYLAIEGARAVPPRIAAQMLIGGTPRSIGRMATGDRLFDELLAVCDGPGGLARAPTTATSRSPALRAAPDPCWREAAIQPNHAYAVLGLHREHDVRHVVLRNPYGWNDVRDAHARGPWQPERDDSGTDPVTLGEDGVVALPEALFQRCFERIDWVDPAA